MKHIIFDRKFEEGSITVIALMILISLSLIGIMSMTTASTDILISGNNRRFKENFYVSEGGKGREETEIGRGRYPVVNVLDTNRVVGRDDALNPNAVANDIDTNGNSVADDAFDHDTPTGDYEFDITYEGYFAPPKGYSPNQFSSYHFTTDSYSDPGESDLLVSARCYKIGPKP